MQSESGISGRGSEILRSNDRSQHAVLLRRVSWVPVLILVVATAGVGFQSKPAYAGAGNCSTGQNGFYFDGGVDFGDGNTTYTTGTSALITVQGGIWCYGNHTNHVMAGWAMLTPKNVQSQYAQSGWARIYNNPTFPEHFSQYTPLPGQGTTPISNFTGDQAPYGDTYEYWTSYDSNCGCEDMWVGGLKLDSTYFNPGVDWQHPLGIQDLGEVHNSHDGMIGKPYPNTSHWDYISTQVIGGTWQPFRPDTPINDNPSLWYLNFSHSCSYVNVQWCLDTWS